MSEEIPHAADRIDEAVAAIERPVTELYVYSRRTRRLLIAMFVSLAFDVIVSALLTVFAFQAHDTAHRAHLLTNRIGGLSRDRAFVACIERNKYKALDKERWERALTMVSAEQQRQFRSFKDYIGSVDSPENCRLISDNPGALLDPTPQPTAR
jgi:hypothetical protein